MSAPKAWPAAVAMARAWQVQLAPLVSLRPLPGLPRVLAGVDAAYGKDDQHLYGAAVLLAWPELTVLESVSVAGPVPFPYIPGLLSFREAPILQAAVRKLTVRPDVIMVDGQGIAHPRGLGLASHLGLLLGIPTIGCAKSRLTGEFGELGQEKGSWCPLLSAGLVVGYVVRSRRGCRPVFVSPGHLITLAESLALVRTCLGGYRLPVPLRAAHLASTQVRRERGAASGAPGKPAAVGLV